MIPGSAALLITGFVIGVKVIGPAPSPVTTPIKIVKSYPAPDVSVLAQEEVRTNVAAVSSSSSFYGSGDDRYGRPHSRHHHKKQTAKKSSGPDADPDLGTMAADDPKLLEAIKRAEEKQDASHYKDWETPQPPNSH
jgi:hypothetical protein